MAVLRGYGVAGGVPVHGGLFPAVVGNATCAIRFVRPILGQFHRRVIGERSAVPRLDRREAAATRVRSSHRTQIADAGSSTNGPNRRYLSARPRALWNENAAFAGGAAAYFCVCLK